MGGRLFSHRRRGHCPPTRPTAWWDPRDPYVPGWPSGRVAFGIPNPPSRKATGGRGRTSEARARARTGPGCTRLGTCVLRPSDGPETDGIAGARAWVGAKGEGGKQRPSLGRGGRKGKERKAGAFSHFTPPFREFARGHARALSASRGICGWVHCIAPIYKKKPTRTANFRTGVQLRSLVFLCGCVLKGCVKKNASLVGRTSMLRYLLFIVLSNILPKTV